MLFYALPVAALALGVLAKDKSSTTTAAPTRATDRVGYFFPPLPKSGELGLFPGHTTGSYVSANVVDADPCSSTLDLVFSASKLGDHTITITDGVSDYKATYSLSTDGMLATLSESCKKHSDSAVCTNVISNSFVDSSSSATVTTTLTGDEFSTAAHRGLTVGSGGSKLAKATGSCTKPGNAAAPTGLGTEIYKVVVVPAAAVMAAALI